MKLLDKFYEPLESLVFDDECASYYGILREGLTKKGQLIGANDMLIAAVALRYQMILVTHNVKEFSRILELHIEDWEM